MATSEAESIVSSIKNLNVESLSAEDKVKLRGAATSLLEVTSTPWDLCMRLCIEQPSVLASVNTCIDTGLFEAWGKHGGADLTAEELAGIVPTKLDPVLLERLLRLLAAAGLVESVGSNKYGLAPFSKWLQDPINSSCVRCCSQSFMPAFQHLPEFLKAIDYQNNTDPKVSNFGSAFNIQGTMYDYFGDNPSAGKDFHLTMQSYQQNLPPWTDQFPTEQLLPRDDDESPILVDVGGGTGQMLILFAQKHKVSRERLINQDRAEVVAGAITGDYGLSVTHDFFTEQTVKGAQAYFLSNILHNYSDEDCKRILTNIKSAMTPGKSKILIFEVVLHPDHLNMHGTGLDILMMTLLSAQERTYDQWQALITSVDLQITKVHYHPLSPKAVIEVDL